MKFKIQVYMLLNNKTSNEEIELQVNTPPPEILSNNHSLYRYMCPFQINNVQNCHSIQNQGQFAMSLFLTHNRSIETPCHF